MKIQYLGTAAAEGYPAIYCQCEACEKARELGGKDIRTRSQAIVDDKILIDFPADTYMHSLIHNVRLDKVRTCIITHDHHDHLYPADAGTRYGCNAHMKEESTLTFYGTAPSMAKIRLSIKGQVGPRIATEVIRPFEPFEAEGYKITPLRARHDVYCDPVIYLIEKDGKVLFYAHDTGDILEETFDYIEKNVKHIDFASFDCCGNETHIMVSHMNTETVVYAKERLEKMGVIDKNTICYVNHYSHNINRTHQELCDEMNKKGFGVSYDGEIVEF